MTCTKCSLHKTRINMVNGEGNVMSPVFLIGEAPGMNEDISGRPFQGQAGTILNKILTQAGLNRADFYIDNVVKCRPTITKINGKDNRQPTAEEIELCRDYLEQSIATGKPKVIVAMGNIALKYLLSDRTNSITKMRGQFIWSDKYQCYVYPVLHPAAILRQFTYYNVTASDFLRLKQFIDNNYALPTPVPTSYTLVDTPELLGAVLSTLEQQTCFSFDVETTGLNFISDSIICLNLSWKESTGYVIPFLWNEDKDDHKCADLYWKPEIYHDMMERLRKVFSNPKVTKIAHAFKFDMKFLRKYKIEVSDPAFDTLLAHYILDENAKGMRKLKHLAWQYTDMGGYELDLDIYKKAHDLGESFVGIPYSVMLKYAAGDADCTFRLFCKFKKMLEEQKLSKLFSTLVMPMSRVYSIAEYDGIKVDTAYIKTLDTSYTKQLGDLETTIQAVAQQELNIRSPKQLRELLFDKLQLKSTKLTESEQLSTDKSVLSKLSHKHKLPKLILEYRDIHKLHTTNINGLIWDSNDRVHTEYNLAQTLTGRLSSSGPNLQNIPRSSNIKNIFIAESGHSLVEGDFAQIEFRLWAHYSQDYKMIVDIESGLDIHRLVASYVFNIPMAQISKEQRVAAKNCVFGLMYGRGSKSVAEQYGLSITQADAVVKTFKSMYPTATRWLDIIVLEAKRTLELTNFFGRKRRFVAFGSMDPETIAFTEREAKNYLMQSTASDITNFTAIRMDILKDPFQARLALNVHDCLVYEVPDHNVGEFSQCFRAEGNRPIHGILVPINIELKQGKKWGSMEDIH